MQKGIRDSTGRQFYFYRSLVILEKNRMRRTRIREVAELRLKGLAFELHHAIDRSRSLIPLAREQSDAQHSNRAQRPSGRTTAKSAEHRF
ncbi:MAG TPA: hypothetical protein PKA88_14050 [Polyangiaceae bacterium]|nr:hypothetical protein [Polyangiaceae bacterium]